MLPLFKVRMNENVAAAVNAVLYSGYIGQGSRVEQFEELLQKKFFNKNIITVNSGTSGLHLLYHSLGEDGDEVLTSPLTCTATNWPIVLNRKKIKWVDVDDSCNIDLDDLERKLSPTTKFISLVHWGGNVIDLNRIEKIRNKCRALYGFKPIIIQDCAHAIGSQFDGKYLSEYYNAVYSFQAIKHITSCDGGMICTQDKGFSDRLKLLRWYGIDRDDNRKDFRCENDIEEVGFKFHMSDLIAAIGICNFAEFESIVNSHISNATYFNEYLAGTDVRLIYPLENTHHSYWVYTMHVDKRDDFIKYMKSNGVMTSRVHERNDIHSCVKEFKTALPNLDKVVQSMVCIPCHWAVTEEDREKIVGLIKKGW